MNKERLYIIIKRILIVIAAIHFLLFWISVARPLFIPFPSSQKELKRFESKRLYFGEIADYIVCKDKLYILYSYKSVLECFDLNGNYLFSYALKPRAAGNSHIFTDGSTVYLWDLYNNTFMISSEGNVEGFEKGQSYKQSIGENILRGGQERIADNGDQYELRWASIYKITTEGEVIRVVRRPFWMAVFQRGRTILVAFVIFLVLFIFQKIEKR